MKLWKSYYWILYGFGFLLSLATGVFVFKAMMVPVSSIIKNIISFIRSLMQTYYHPRTIRKNISIFSWIYNASEVYNIHQQHQMK